MIFTPSHYLCRMRGYSQLLLCGMCNNSSWSTQISRRANMFLRANATADREDRWTDQNVAYSIAWTDIVACCLNSSFRWLRQCSPTYLLNQFLQTVNPSSTSVFFYPFRGGKVRCTSSPSSILRHISHVGTNSFFNGKVYKFVHTSALRCATNLDV